jgi:acetyl esterase
VGTHGVTLNPQTQQIMDLLDSRGGKPVSESTVAEARAATWDWLEFQGDPEPVARVWDTYIAGPTAELHVRVYTPAGSGPFPCLIFFHGGGWTVGNLEISDAPNRSLTNATGCVVVAVNYQTAPEHPYPAALEDCSATVHWVLDHAAALDVDPRRVGVGGDSAGGNLAAAVTLRARGAGDTRLAFQLLIYPAVDPEMDYPSARENAEGYGLTTEAMQWFWNHYVPDARDRRDPLAAPIHAISLEGLPPAIVITVEHDPLRDEGERYAQLLAHAGVPVHHHRYPGTVHGILWMAGAVTVDFHRLMTDLAADLATILSADR